MTTLPAAQESPFAVSWSGGKDAFLALLLYQQSNPGSRPVFFTYYSTSRYPGCDIVAVNRDLHLLLDQTRHFGGDHHLVINTSSCSVTLLGTVSAFLRDRYGPLEAFIFGDIIHNSEKWLIEKNRKGGCDACIARSRSPDNLRANVVNVFEGRTANELLAAYEEQHIEAVVFEVGQQKYRPLVGGTIDQDFLLRNGMLGSGNIDALGEAGEYHTVVTGFGEKKFKRTTWLESDGGHHLFGNHVHLRDALDKNEKLDFDIFSDCTIVSVIRNPGTETFVEDAKPSSSGSRLELADSAGSLS